VPMLRLLVYVRGFSPSTRNAQADNVGAPYSESVFRAPILLEFIRLDIVDGTPAYILAVSFGAVRLRFLVIRRDLVSYTSD
jgi:hypothetical protein